MFVLDSFKINTFCSFINNISMASNNKVNKLQHETLKNCQLMKNTVKIYK